LESQQIHENNFASEAEGFDVGLFNRFSSLEYFPVRLHTWKHRLLSEPVEVFAFDFLRDTLGSEVREFSLRVAQSGQMHGVLFWFAVDLGAGWQLTNAPGCQTHWMQAVQCFEEPRFLRAGECVTLRASHETTSIFFELA
jgi:type II protein arginine methyltransferase